MILLLLSFFCLCRAENHTEEQARGSKVLVNIVKFPNDACTASTGKSGVCYTASECSALSGTAYGTCASGFGVCCFFKATCGQSTLKNNTYFQSTGGESSPCTLTVCKAADNICQFRMDFDTFSIDQPVNYNVIGAAGAVGSDSAMTVCQSAQFYAASDGGTSPVICGTNTGYHMIVEAKDNCNPLTFTWTSSSSVRAWDIKISQIPCDVVWKSPAGCTQYFTGTSGIVYSYNYQGGVHLANQNYLNCIRTEEGYCSIGYAAATSNFQISFASSPLTATSTAIVGNGENCFTDYIIIPKGSTSPAAAPPTATTANYDRFCGNLLGINNPPTSPVLVSSVTPATIYSVKYPFQIGVYTDGGEKWSPVAVEPAKGFAISYLQQAGC